MLGLGNSLTKGGLTGPTIVTDSLVLKHNYAAGGVVPVSDGAAFFDGTDDYATMGDITGVDGSATLTLACWVFITDDGVQPFITKGNYNASGRCFHWDIDWGGTSGRLRFSVVNEGVNGGFWYRNSMNQYITQNAWHYIAVTYSKTNERVYFYVDGIQYSPTNYGASNTFVDIPDTTDELKIGQSATTTNFFKGYICNAGVWTAELTPAQIKSFMWKNYAGLTDSEKTNLVSWWNLDVGYDEALHDGTQYGTVLDNHHAGNTTSFGAEMVTNGDFSNGTTGWTAGDDASVEIEVVNDGLELKITSDPDSGEYGLVSNEVNFVVGKTYKIEIDIISATNASATGLEYIRIGTHDSATDGGSGQEEIHSNTDEVINTVGTHVRYYKHAGGGNTHLWVGCRHDVTSFIFDNVSVKEVLGNTGQTL